MEISSSTELENEVKFDRMCVELLRYHFFFPDQTHESEYQLDTSA